jgi:ABC-type nitrate/sulfonate/bicarbonate transport system permease component
MMSMPQNHSRDPQNQYIGATGSVIAPVNIDWLGFISDVIPLMIVGAAYAVSSQFLPFAAGPPNATGIQDHLMYSLGISLGGGAIGLFGGLVLAFVMGNATEQNTDQRFIFFTVFPLMPLLGLLTILWFGLKDATGGIVLAALVTALAVTSIVLPVVRDAGGRRSALIDAAVLAIFCALGAEITREVFGSDMGLGALASKAMYTFDMATTFFVLFIIALLTTVLAVTRRTIQLYLSMRAI